MMSDTKSLDDFYANLAEKMGSKDYNKIPNIILKENLINDIEEKLKISENDNTYEKKNEEFEKFYNEVLKSSFEKILQESANDLLNQEFPQGALNNLNNIRLESKIPLKLPVFKYTAEILKAIDDHTFVLIKGETGSGKTTQIPQMILDHHIKRGLYCHIICTQPRRISAVSIAERVAYERDENLGESVGYKIHLEYVPPRDLDSVLYCTTGVLLRMMISDPILAKVSHVILDEIHERFIESDLLIGLLQLVVKYNKKIKVLLMSATFGFEEYSRHFSQFKTKIINIEGTIHPVKCFYLEDILEDTQFFNFQRPEMFLKRRNHHLYQTPDQRAEEIAKKRKLEKFQKMMETYTTEIRDKYSSSVIAALKNPFSEEINLNLIERLIDHIDRKMPEGAILVFLPGYEKISNLYDLLYNIDKVSKGNYLIYAVHSIMPTSEQKEIFDAAPPGIRKIVLATNIAETSITIDDVVYVINPGKEKVKHYDLKNKTETLEEYWITKASAVQRQGRAGRCKPGICFNLYTKIREENFEEYPIPEIQRARMESVIMCLKSLKIHDCKNFLQSLISSPDDKTIENGIAFLQKLNALDKDEVMTPLGLHLAQLPMDPQIGKMLLISTIFDCVDPITSVAATLSLKEPFRQPMKQKAKSDEAKLKFSYDSRSDHITYANVIKEYRKSVNDNNTEEFCEENFINQNSVDNIEKMKIQLCELLSNSSTGFIQYPLPDHSDINKCSSKENILRAVITSGLYPNVAILRSVSKKLITYNMGNRLEHIIETPENGNNVKFNNTSINRKENKFNSKYFMYFNKHKAADYIYLRESTMCSPISIIIFADNISIQSDVYGNYFIIVGDVLRFPTNQRTANLLLKLRQRFEKFLKQIAINPKVISEIVGNDKNVIDALKMLFIEDELLN